MRLISLLLLSAACGGGGGPGKLTGTVAGNGLEVKDAVLLSDTEMWLSSAPDTCKLLQKNTYPKDGAFMKLALYPVATGEFAVDPSASSAKDHTVFAQFNKLNATCGNTLAFGQSTGTKGTVTIVRFDSKVSLEGSFDITFGDTDAVSGTFRAAWCMAPTSFPTPECQ